MNPYAWFRTLEELSKKVTGSAITALSNVTDGDERVRLAESMLPDGTLPPVDTGAQGVPTSVDSMSYEAITNLVVTVSLQLDPASPTHLGALRRMAYGVPPELIPMGWPIVDSESE